MTCAFSVMVFELARASGTDHAYAFIVFQESYAYQMLPLIDHRFITSDNIAF